MDLHVACSQLLQAFCHACSTSSPHAKPFLALEMSILLKFKTHCLAQCVEPEGFCFLKKTHRIRKCALKEFNLVGGTAIGKLGICGHPKNFCCKLASTERNSSVLCVLEVK